MVFPNNRNYYDFDIKKGGVVSFTFPTKKPKTFFFSCSGTTTLFTININKEGNFIMYPQCGLTNKLVYPGTIDSIDISTTIEESTHLGIFIEEWGN